MNIFLVKCKCQHCNQPLEFEAQHAGELIQCPNCSLETVLFIPSKPEESNRSKLEKFKPSRGFQIWARIRALTCFLILLTLVGCAFSSCGFFPTNEESSLRNRRLSAAQRWSRFDKELKAAEKANNYDISKLIDQWSEASADMITSDSELKQKIKDRENGTFYLFILSFSPAVLWIPGLLYLFIVPKPEN